MTCCSKSLQRANAYPGKQAWEPWQLEVVQQCILQVGAQVRNLWVNMDVYEEILLWGIQLGYLESCCLV